MKTPINARFIAQSAIIAALYAALTLIVAPLSYGPVQCRISEALTILPIFTLAAVPGLFIGCLVANLYTGSVLDVIFGSLATLLAAVWTRSLRNRPVLATAPPVLVNAVVVGLVLSLTIENYPFWFSALTVGAGQLVACMGLGNALRMALHRLPESVRAMVFTKF